ncbi:N-acetylglucosamine-6-sulfatase-like isoform X1 [Chironomus tepperi]|uniref:N-acetylglucosamine-6-sulfatase-like isoform X1 n=1 Tax=Chironomus tepperi TaxID=113505 RepID=UPI00391FA8F7
MQIHLIALSFLIFLSSSVFGKFNFIIFLTDDQDLILNSLEPLKNIEKFVTSKGVIFKNAFTTSPICCPSRSAILTGLYAHNTRTFNNSVEGGCYSNEWIKEHEGKTFPALLHDNGYRTFYAGKYLNDYYSKKVPYGYDDFYGLHGNSKYYNYTLTENGRIVEYGDMPEDYLTNVIKNQAKEFISNQSKDEPFLAVISTPSCHAPFTPEEKYKDALSNYTVPRSENFNVGAKATEKHWLLTMKPKKLSESVISKIEHYYRSRLQTLLSVDDMVGDIINQLEEQSLIDNTYIIFTSDNGYHLGNWAMPWDKRLPYETDIKIPLIIRGPNIQEKAVVDYPVALIDLAPTILSLAGISYDLTQFDGEPFDKLIDINNVDAEQLYERQILIEHYGEGTIDTFNPECPWRKSQRLAGCSIEADCKCQDSWNNTYACVRHLASDVDFLYCSFDDRENFNEAFDLSADPYQMNNIAYDILPSVQAIYQLIAENLKYCQGDSCRVIRPIYPF